ncbi:GNAT family N-acetyltransferase [Loktanella sp. Alg231-35]|uniref:GNAT family N-acetyltransferase n=1 Tax=Loktanella sp. Alg231-35 TaxID=1922220 RepID=UPI000D5569EB|nr:GNAT family N-acetyltransferase [Loktanella sp. Alg231-35]
MTVPTLRTTRLTLRDFREGDLDDVVRHVSNYDVSKWLVPVRHPYGHADAEEFLAMDRAGDIGLLWMILRDDALVGAVSTGKELGYWLAEPAWGQGYMTEAAQAAVDHTFQTDNLEVMKSSHFVGNHGSQRVLQKLGFADVGAHVHHSLARQADVPGRSMELTRNRWEGRTR